MTIRPLSTDDHPAILDLWSRAGLGTIRPEGRDSREAMSRQLESGRQTVLGLEEGGALVGVVIAGHDGRKGWISRLAVDPSARREGRGRALVAEAEAVLRSQGIEVFAALVESDNAPSVALFEDAGYRIARHVLYLSKRPGPDA